MNVLYPKINEFSKSIEKINFLIQKYAKFTIDTKGLVSDDGNIDHAKITPLYAWEKKKDQDGNSGLISIFGLYDVLGGDELAIKKALIVHIRDGLSFDYDGKKVNYDDISVTKNKKLIEIANQQILKDGEMILHDILEYHRLKDQTTNQLEDDVIVGGENKKFGQLLDFWKQKMLTVITDQMKAERLDVSSSYDIPSQDMELLEILGMSGGASDKEFKEFEDIARKKKFFHQIQQAMRDGYIITYREMHLINDIIEDVKNQNVILLTGDTGSGKTELARFISKKYLGGKYIFVGGSKNKEDTDFTIEKVVTSKSQFDINKDIVSDEITDKSQYIEHEAVKYMSDFLMTKEFMTLVCKKAEESGMDTSEIQELEKDLRLSSDQKHLITEYHLMGIYRAAHLGLPCIIDEVNTIRPEVLMALNDVITRKTGDAIQLPNALGSLEVKQGFAIIMTGNDSEQNPNAKKYMSGRYQFDEAFYNRLRVYAKGYFNQIIESHNENKLEELDKTLSYLNDNELYGVLLMTFFTDLDQSANKKNNGATTATKYGFDLIKTSFSGEIQKKEDIFTTIKNFAYSISQIQQAFSGNNIILKGKYASISLKDSIKRKVISMRQIIDILNGYRKDNIPLEYHIYNEFVKGATNEKEKYGLLVCFSNFGFFGDVVTDDMKASISNVEKYYQNARSAKNHYTKEQVANKIIITKHDLYGEYFGTMQLDDDVFGKNIAHIDSFSKVDAGGESHDEILVTRDNLIELADSLIKTFHAISDILDLSIYMQLGILLEFLKTKSMDGGFDTKIQSVYKNFLRLFTLFDKIQQTSSSSQEDIDAIFSIFKDIESV